MALGESALSCWRALILLLLSYASTRAQADCAPYPLALRVGNVSLSNGKVARGVEVAVGEPEQKFAFMPQWDRNGILLYGTDTSKAGWEKDGYTSYRGGYYDPTESKTRKAAALDDYPDNPKRPKVTPITETMRLNDNITLDNFQMGIALSDWDTQGYRALMSFGLGTNSTLLQALRSSKKIASKTWSFFWGRGFGMTSQLDGSFIFGGYDRAKVTGKRYTAKMTPNIPHCDSQLVVNVSDLKLNFPSGEDVSIFPKSSPRPVMSTCIVPSSPIVMALPLRPYFNNWMTETQHDIYRMNNSLGYYWWNEMYMPEDKPYAGALTISFSSGLEIRISNEQLVMDDISIDNKTGDTLANGTRKTMLVTSLQAENANDMPRLGFQFLAAAYLQVNQDAGQFSLWQANPTADEDVVALDVADAEVSEFCPVITGGDGHGTGPDTSDDSLSKGAIAGIVVGAVAGVAGVVGLAMWLFKKKKSAAAAKAPLVPEQSTSDYEPRLHSTLQNKAPILYELDHGDASTQGPRHELA